LTIVSKAGAESVAQRYRTCLAYTRPKFNQQHEVIKTVKPEVVAQVCNPAPSGGGGGKVTSSRAGWAKLGRPYL
jgi:hypothetical protein